MSVHVRWMVLAAGLAAAGFLFGRTFSRPPPAPEPRGAALAIRELPPRAARPDDDDVRRVRDAVLLALRGSPPREAVAPSSQPRSPEQEAAGAALERDLAGALSAGQWTDADRDALRANLVRATSEDQFETLRRFSVAVNEGRLRIETRGLPF